MQNKGNILIYRLGSLGDTVLALPCFHKVRSSYPKAMITLLTNKPVISKAAPLEAVLNKNYFFDKVIAYPVGTRNIYLISKIISQIRSLQISTVINLNPARSKGSTLRDWLFFRAAGIKNFIGFPRLESDYQVAIDPATGLFEWEAKRLSRRLIQLGNISLSDDRNWDLMLSHQEIAEANTLVKGFDEKKTVVVSVGTKVQSKDWEIQNWIHLLKKLSEKLPGWKMVVIGAKEEKDLSEQCLSAWNIGGVNLCGLTSPRVSAAILKQSALFIGHDSGPMHLAACVGTPCVAIFSARSLNGQWSPRGKHNSILYHQTNCAGCGLDICIEQQKRCILSITVDEVLTACLGRIYNETNKEELASSLGR